MENGDGATTLADAPRADPPALPRPPFASLVGPEPDPTGSLVVGRSAPRGGLGRGWLFGLIPLGLATTAAIAMLWQEPSDPARLGSSAPAPGGLGTLVEGEVGDESEQEIEAGARPDDRRPAAGNQDAAEPGRGTASSPGGDQPPAGGTASIDRRATAKPTGPRTGPTAPPPATGPAIGSTSAAGSPDSSDPSTTDPAGPATSSTAPPTSGPPTSAPATTTTTSGPTTTTTAPPTTTIPPTTTTTAPTPTTTAHTTTSTTASGPCEAVVGAEVPLFNKAGGNQIDTVPPSTYRVRKQSGSWYKIRGGGFVGWLRGSDIASFAGDCGS